MSKPLLILPRLTLRHSSTTSSSNPSIRALLSTPTWSISSVLPQSQSQSSATPSELPILHLLRLSALPVPSSETTLSSISSTLKSQLHFVHAIQQVDTTDVPPLSSIRDETDSGLKESTISLSHPAIQKALSEETVVGKWKRPRRKQPSYLERQREEAEEVERTLKNWDVLGTASEKIGGYFVVRSGKGE
ncbi:hypothetical protein QBC44DRAFT_338023 [Cladorrhinum sp. PSN332]|nr:hypothetical protein QBC44DRAFT_338023 [Cladorrhinum sp. PSN332]